MLLAGDVSLNPGPSTCSTDRVRLETLNAKSMKNKAASLADMVSSKKIDILAITETWLKPSDTLSCLSDLTPQDVLFYKNLELMEEGWCRFSYLKWIQGNRLHHSIFFNIWMHMFESFWQFIWRFSTLYVPSWTFAFWHFLPGIPGIVEITHTFSNWVLYTRWFQSSSWQKTKPHYY